MNSDYSARAAGVHAEKAVEHLAARDLVKARKRHGLLVTETNKIGAAILDAIMERDTKLKSPRVAGRIPSLAIKTPEELADMIREAVDWDTIGSNAKQDLEAVADEVERRLTEDSDE